MNHHAKIENSPRLQRVLAVLEDGAWHSTLDVAKEAGTVAPAASIAELRSNGIEVEVRTVNDGNGKRIWQYRVVGLSNNRQEEVNCL